MRVFNLPSDRKFMVSMIQKYSLKCNIEVLGYCLMDNHFHFILRQGFTDTISKFMQRTMTAYCMFFNSKYSLVGRTFQDRFKSKIIPNYGDLSNILMYVMNNPVAAGYVKNPFHYTWMYINPEYEKCLSIE